MRIPEGWYWQLQFRADEHNQAQTSNGGPYEFREEAEYHGSDMQEHYGGKLVIFREPDWEENTNHRERL